MLCSASPGRAVCKFTPPSFVLAVLKCFPVTALTPGMSSWGTKPNQSRILRSRGWHQGKCIFLDPGGQNLNLAKEETNSLSQEQVSQATSGIKIEVQSHSDSANLRLKNHNTVHPPPCLPHSVRRRFPEAGRGTGRAGTPPDTGTLVSPNGFWTESRWAYLPPAPVLFTRALPPHSFHVGGPHSRPQTPLSSQNRSPGAPRPAPQSPRGRLRPGGPQSSGPGARSYKVAGALHGAPRSLSFCLQTWSPIPAPRLCHGQQRCQSRHHGSPCW